jgi:hypothetical protein
VIVLAELMISLNSEYRYLAFAVFCSPTGRFSISKLDQERP